MPLPSPKTVKKRGRPIRRSPKASPRARVAAAEEQEEAEAQFLEDYNRDYEVEAIVNDTIVGTEHYYNVKWVGFSEDQNSWLLEESLGAAQDALEDYKARKQL